MRRFSFSRLTFFMSFGNSSLPGFIRKNESSFFRSFRRRRFSSSLAPAFAYFLLFPVGFKYFVTYGAPSDVPLLTIDSYYSTCLKLLLLFGVAFELPVLICLLGYLGLVDAPFLRAQRKTAIIMISIVAALFAPPDAVSMLILGGPLVLMYEGSIWVVQWLGVRERAA